MQTVGSCVTCQHEKSDGPPSCAFWIGQGNAQQPLLCQRLVHPAVAAEQEDTIYGACRAWRGRICTMVHAGT